MPLSLTLVARTWVVKNEEDKNGEEDADDSNEKKEGGEGMDMSKIGSESKMWQFIKATYLTDKKQLQTLRLH
jgi:hypothetical protein